MTNTKTNRYVALDVLRGMTVAGMILVNNPGSWQYAFAPLRHSPWNGCTPTDLVFPFFLFIVGAAMAFSFAKYGDGLNGSSLKKIFRRGALIFLVGLALNAVSFRPHYIEHLQHLRIFGVLQRIALSYIVGAVVVLWLKKPKRIWMGLVSLIVIHWLVLRIFGGDAWNTLEGNISGKIDVAIVGANHVYHGYGIPFDPEGLLGVLTGACTVMLGYLIGQTVRNTPTKPEAVSKLYTFGLLFLAIGCVLGIWLPINKPMWTGSYVFYAGGWATVMLAFFIYLIDIKGCENRFTIFKAMGMNPLSIYVLASFFATLFGSFGISSWFYTHCCVSIFGNNEMASLMYALVYVALFIAIAMILYRKKIILKL